jgi:FAD:protein FMN transferase
MLVRIILLLFVSLVGRQAFSQLQRFSYTQSKMGSPFTIIFYCADSSRANTAVTRCFSIVDSINQQLSDYLADSELNKLCRNSGSGQWVALPAHFWNVLSQSKDAFKHSRGSFDVTIGPVTKMWRRARAENVFPDPPLVAEQMKKVNNGAVLTDSVHRQVLLTRYNMQLDFGGIAKGYAAQAVVDYLRSVAIPCSLADAGGDIAVGMPPPGKKGWQLGVNIPNSSIDRWDRTIELSQGAVATSGDLYQYLEHNNKFYSHIVDPRTGYGVTHRRNVTVIAAQGALADWLATACSILPIKKAMSLARKMNAHLFIAEWRDGTIYRRESEGWNQYWSN